ncbi:flagellar motor switch protein FliM [Salinibacterium sp. ZJ454]|uniref:flagellar motor switch protein FliM n=1 Tax=Salinibacterium sp. ZJ454 TaxID=2708339 RepID=UPI001FB9DB73|nr:flagellar motor switch protein FliM [Salinibacterium sp. ZJ454]
MTVQEHTRTSAPTRLNAESAKSVEVYDFRRPTTLAREHSRVLELAIETFARQWGTQLTAKVRVVSHVTSEQVVMLTYDEYAASLPPTTAMVLCELQDHTAKAVIQFATSSALTWVGYMLGGNGGQPAPNRKFTQIEQALVRKLMDDALEDLRYSLGSLLVTPISVDTIHYNSQFAQAAATTDLMIVASFEIRVGDNTTSATLAIPADALLPQLGETNPMSTTANARQLMQAQLVSVPVDVSLQLAPAKVKPGMILGLSVGDLIPIPHPHHRPLDLAVDGQSLARAAVGANGSRLACVVVSSPSGDGAPTESSTEENS